MAKTTQTPKAPDAAKDQPKADPQATIEVTPKGGPRYVYHPLMAKGSGGKVRLTAKGKALGIAAKRSPQSKTGQRYAAFLAALDKAGGSLTIDDAYKYQTQADLGWSYRLGDIEVVK